MRVKDLMELDVLALHENETVEDAVDRLVARHLQGAPVIDDAGRLVGIISPWDLYFATMTRKPQDGREEPPREPLRIGEIMTAPAVSTSEETSIADVCEMMYRLRIHRVPVVRSRRLIGIISALDVCRAVASGEKLP